jgi:hypothetical protein
MDYSFVALTPPETEISDKVPYYGWYSEALQQLRVSHQTEHKYKGKLYSSPPYTYWYKDNKKILVTEITLTNTPTPRQIKNGDICLGQLDKYWGRSYVKLKEN